MQEVVHSSPPPTRRGWLALLGLGLLLGGVPAYFALLDNALMRSSGLPTFALAAVGVGLAFVAAWSDRRVWVRSIAFASGLLLAFLVAAFFWFAALPAPTTESAAVMAPDFTLPDQDERPTVLRDAYANGPVLLVFYRGHW